MRIKLVKRYLLTIVVASLGLGAIILWLALTTIPGPTSMIVNATLLVWMVGVAASLLFAKYGFKNYRSSYLEKGLAAETLIGRRIEGGDHHSRLRRGPQRADRSGNTIRRHRSPCRDTRRHCRGGVQVQGPASKQVQKARTGSPAPSKRSEHGRPRAPRCVGQSSSCT